MGESGESLWREGGLTSAGSIAFLNRDETWRADEDSALARRGGATTYRHDLEMQSHAPSDGDFRL
jgi:hypothetical protein